MPTPESRPIGSAEVVANMIVSMEPRGHPLAAGRDDRHGGGVRKRTSAGGGGSSYQASNMIIVEPKGHPLQQLPDLTDRLKALGAHDEYVKYRNDYLKWRKGGAKGADGEVEAIAGSEGQDAATKQPSESQNEDEQDTEEFATPFVVVMWGSVLWNPFKEKKATGKSILIDVKAVVAEFLTMAFFVFLGCGSAMGNDAGDASQRLMVAFTFGMSIMILAYSVAHHSGGHINCAVTLALVINGITPWYQGVLYLIAQLLGSLLGALLLSGIYSCDADLTGGLGSNAVDLNNFSAGQALVAEVIGTFLLVYVIFESAVTSNSSSGKNACLVIGFAVFVVHLVLLPIDGCSINPARSFGPAIISSARKCGPADGMRDLWIMWVGPAIGATLAAMIYLPFSQITVLDKTPDSDDDEPAEKPQAPTFTTGASGTFKQSMSMKSKGGAE
mmetsp:Transcript_14113/g.38800  ORF Transcript_14113/g.38800 Transcript_14113/m.38800 type:complete len:443 (-) Transcript_14113:432-1760(-)